MRKSLLAALPAVALLIAPAAFSPKSNAAGPVTPKPAAAPTRTAPQPLPNYDIRLAGRGEFEDSDLSSNAGRQRAAASSNVAVQSRAASVEKFRVGMRPGLAQSLRA